MATTEILLHGVPLSGHTHRVGLMLRALGLPYRFVEAGREVRAGAAYRASTLWGRPPCSRTAR